MYIKSADDTVALSYEVRSSRGPTPCARPPTKGKENALSQNGKEESGKREEALATI